MDKGEIMENLTKELIIEKLAESLNITPAQYNDAKLKYERLKKLFEEKVSPIDVYLQGSFALGTVIRPIKNMEEQDFDIDIVCQQLNQNQSLGEIKNEIGDILKSTTYVRWLEEEGRRCWTLNYNDGDGEGLHMDILPCVDESLSKIFELKHQAVRPDLVDTAIKITHKEEDSLYVQRTSNPRGLIKWFNEVSLQTYSEDIIHDKVKLFRKYGDYFRFNLGYTSANDVEDYFVKTPLQKTIQILKRHRDVMFSGKPNEEYKPISAIITVLVTKIAENNIGNIHSTYDLLDIVVNTINEYSQLTTDGVDSGFLNMENRLIEKLPNCQGWRIENPTNPGENLADRWHEDSNARARAFFEWIDSVSSHLRLIVENLELDKLKPILAFNFGRETANETHRLCEKVLSEISTSNNIQPIKPWKDVC